MGAGRGSVAGAGGRMGPTCWGARFLFGVVCLFRTGALAVGASRPAAGAALTLFEFFLQEANAALPGAVVFGVFHPADELVAGQRGDVVPGGECCSVAAQRLVQVRGQLVHHPTGNVLAGHTPTVASGW